MSVESIFIRNWCISTIGTDAKIKGRIGWKGYKTSDLRDSGPVVLGGNNIRNCKYLDLNVIKHLSREKYDESPEIQLKKNDILLVTRGNGIGDVSFFNGEIDEATINPSMVIISEFQGISEFLFYYLISKLGKDNVLSVSSGSSIPAIYQNQLAKVEYVKPPIPEQKAIAATLSALDDAIELNNQINKKLEEIVQAIFKSWFVDFEPFKDGEFEESELGLIPKGWRVDSIGNCTSIVTRGIAPKYADISDRHVINQKCIRDGSLNTALARPHCSVVKEEKKLQFGDVLINSTGVGTLGRVAQVYEQLENYTVDSHVTIVRQNMSNGIGYFGCLLKNMQPKFENAATGSTGQTELGRESIKQMRILIPNNKIIDEFSKIYNSFSNKIVYYKKENTVLSNIRDTLLPKIISGEIRVPVEEVE